MTGVELVVAALATWQAVEIWRHSNLMAPLRARAELREDKLGELLGCPFCLSVWVGAAACLAMWVPLPEATAAGVATGAVCLLLVSLLGVIGYAGTRVGDLWDEGVEPWRPWVATVSLGVATAGVLLVIFSLTSYATTARRYRSPPGPSSSPTPWRPPAWLTWATT